jgi:L-2-hydroxyglutarate oxidase LhgO
VDELYRRALANGARAEIVDEKRLREIEPEATTCGKALYSPDTAVIDAKAVLRALHADNNAAGARLVTSSEVREIDAKERIIRTKSLDMGYGYLINAAGLHADRIAKLVGAGARYRILPFKGLYRKLRPEAAARYRGSIYPVPDLGVPFLGVHITRGVSGEVTLGPTAVPAFGRENYSGLDGLDLREAPAMARDLALMMASNRDGFRRMVFEEAGRYRRSAFVSAARALSPSLKAEDIVASDKVGIRAQLFDTREKRLVMDLVVEEGDRSLHVLNAISPAFTGSMAFAELVVDRILGGKK